MKTYSHKLKFILSCLAIWSCTERLDEVVFSELSPSTLLTTEQGLSSLLNASYSYAHRAGFAQVFAPLHMGTFTAGEVWGAGGSIENLWVRWIDFTWDSNHAHIRFTWNVYFNAIRDANLVLDNLDNEAFSSEFREKTEAEAHFIRGWAYSELYNHFGGVPLFQTPSDDPLLARASEEETRTFIEQELVMAINGLPNEPESFGRGAKGVAMSILAKYYLNTKQWQKAADMSNDVINLGQYQLLPNYSDVFAIENEGNEEIIWALPKISTGPSQGINALLFPPSFPRPFPNNSVFAARTYVFDDFVNSFEAGDTRTSQIITEYTQNDGTLVQGLGNDQSHPNKFPWDPNSVGPNAGNDIPIIRYADILLTRAEALNELKGPSQEAIDLINLVRNRANATPLALSGFTKEGLRSAILQEREWEFYFEGKAREDQIRQGVFISRGQARGKNAADHHVLFPIPQVDLDANPALEQNPGY